MRDIVQNFLIYRIVMPMVRFLFRWIVRPVTHFLIVATLLGAFIPMPPATPVHAANEDLTADGTLRRLRVPVLMYHYVSTPPEGSDRFRVDLSVTPENFRLQMRWLKENGYHTITPEQLIAALNRGAKLPPNPVLLTFDDGYEDAYTNAFPILKEFGFVGTFFIVTDWIDSNRRGFLSWDQVKEMADAGMSFQGHSREHQDMRGRSFEWHVWHLVGSQQTIEARLGYKPLLFCYPSGRFDTMTMVGAKAAGVMAAFTTLDGTYLTSDNMLRLPRVRIRNSHSVGEFAYLMEWRR
jgi:peptidoglycan/xylan/chitin deacetylase (PgdA/CDA1 family)